MPVTIGPGSWYETHEEFLLSCADALAEKTFEVRGAVVEDLVQMGYTVTIGVYPQCTTPSSYAAKPYTKLVNRDLPINTSSTIGANHWEALEHLLGFAARIANEKGL